MNKRCSNYRLCIYIVFLMSALFLLMLTALCLGTVRIPIITVFLQLGDIFQGIDKITVSGQGALHDIIWLLRMPRILMSAIVGAGLAVSGVVMQAIVKNPLADPYILGVSSGASLFATVAIMLGIGSSLGSDFIGIAAFLGALTISLLVLFVANMGGRANSVKLLLAGMALSAVCGAFSSFVIYFANNKEGMNTITYWLMGSFAGAQWSVLEVVIPVILISILFFCSQGRILNLMLLGDETAITLGRDLHVYRQVYLMVSSLIVGFAVYAAGMIGFVGLLIPHVIRMLFGTDHKNLIPLSAFTGAILVVWADVLCRIILPSSELPIGILISLIGAPCFVYLMIKKTYGFGGEC